MRKPCDIMDDWALYIGDAKPVRSISLFPAIDQEMDAHALSAMERDRFCYLLDLYPDDPDQMFKFWIDETFMVEERKRFPKLNLSRFYDVSIGLSLLLLRKEIRHLNYLRALRTSLGLRLSIGTPVFFFGPTSGSELEAIHAAGGRPILVSNDETAKWQHLCEARLLDSRVPFDTVHSSELHKSSFSAHHAVLSSWLPEPTKTVKQALRSLGKFGILFNSRTNLQVGHAIKKLSLRQLDTYQTDVGVWFKPPFMEK